MARTGSDKKTRHHNWTTNGVTADQQTHRLAQVLIDSCPFLTPQTENEIDRYLVSQTQVASRESDCEPDPEVLAAMNESHNDDDWGEPTAEELFRIESGILV